MSFLGNALSFLAPLGQARADAQQIRRQRDMEDQTFAQDSALGKERLAQEQQKTRQGKQPVIFGQPEWDASKGTYSALALDPESGRIVRLPVPGGDSPISTKVREYKEALDAFKSVTGSAPSPSMENAIFASVYGIKMPTAGTQHPQLKQDPTTGKYSWVYPPDEFGQVASPVAVRDSDGEQFGGFKPDSVTIRKGVFHFIGADGMEHETPVTTETTRIFGPSAQANGQRSAPTLKPRSSTQTSPSAGNATAYAGHTLGMARKSAQDVGLLEGVQQIQTTADRILPLLEKAKDRGGIGDRVTAERAWLEYKAGLSISDPLYAAIMKDVALLGGIGQSQWTRVGRGKYLFDKMSQHLPKPTDTPALLYSKVKWLSDEVAKETKQAVLDPLGTGAGASTPPPGATVRDWSDLK